MDLNEIAKLAYLDELIALQEGWEKIGAKKEEPGPAPGLAAGAATAGGAGLGALGGGLAETFTSKGGRHATNIGKTEKLVERLGTGLQYAKQQRKAKGKAPIMSTVMERNIPRQEKLLREAEKHLKYLRKLPAPKPAKWMIPVGAALGATAVGAPAGIAAAKKYLKD